MPGIVSAVRRLVGRPTTASSAASPAPATPTKPSVKMARSTPAKSTAAVVSSTKTACPTKQSTASSTGARSSAVAAPVRTTHAISKPPAQLKDSLPKDDVKGRTGPSVGQTVVPLTGKSATTVAAARESDAEALVYRTYADAQTGLIEIEGTERLCSDLELDPSDARILALAWKCGAKRMCVFTADEFCQGLRALNARSIADLRKGIENLVGTLAKDDAAFSSFYQFAFEFGIDRDKGERTLPIEIATALWPVAFQPRPTPWMPEWLAFLESSRTKGISRDLWRLFPEFVAQVQHTSDMQGYSEEDAWSSAIDEFVQWVRAQGQQYAV
eukprot:Opistho-2@76292